MSFSNSQVILYSSDLPGYFSSVSWNNIALRWRSAMLVNDFAKKESAFSLWLCSFCDTCPLGSRSQEALFCLDRLSMEFWIWMFIKLLWTGMSVICKFLFSGGRNFLFSSSSKFEVSRVWLLFNKTFSGWSCLVLLLGHSVCRSHMPMMPPKTQHCRLAPPDMSRAPRQPYSSNSALQKKTTSAFADIFCDVAENKNKQEKINEPRFSISFRTKTPFADLEPNAHRARTKQQPTQNYSLGSKQVHNKIAFGLWKATFWSQGIADAKKCQTKRKTEDETVATKTKNSCELFTQLIQDPQKTSRWLMGVHSSLIISLIIFAFFFNESVKSFYLVIQGHSIVPMAHPHRESAVASMRERLSVKRSAITTTQAVNTRFVPPPAAEHWMHFFFEELRNFETLDEMSKSVALCCQPVYIREEIARHSNHGWKGRMQAVACEFLGEFFSPAFRAVHRRSRK